MPAGVAVWEDSHVRPMIRRASVAAMIAALLAGSIASSVAGADIAESKGFRKAVTLAGVREHQAALQAIADANDGLRASGTPGYDDSAAYVFDRLTAAGYSPTYQEFTFPFVGDRTPPAFQQISPTAVTYVDGVDFGTMQYSGSGDTTASLVAVDLVLPPGPPNSSTSGCEAADFAGFPAGAIALIQRGTCTFRIKAENALSAGATAVVIMNEGQAGRTTGLFGTLSAPMMSIPVLSASFTVGSGLANGTTNGSTGATVRVRADTVSETRTTRNVIAETASGDPSNVVVVGAHLDSVTRGPGINDNGSGSAAILEIAEVFAAQRRDARNKLRFMWYGAEENGLLGSTHYVGSLTAGQQDDIMAMLNFDMVGSPNFVRFVYDGDGSHSSPAGPAGSGFIEKVFVDYFNSQGLASEPTQFSGRSDYGPFIAVGIPAGGLFTGAEGIKTAAQAAIYGGTAGDQYDPCYHLYCDTFANNSNTGLDQMTDAAAHAVLFMSRTKVDIAAPAAAALRSAGGPVQPDFLEHEDDAER